MVKSNSHYKKGPFSDRTNWSDMAKKRSEMTSPTNFRLKKSVGKSGVGNLSDQHIFGRKKASTEIRSEICRRCTANSTQNGRSSAHLRLISDRFFGRTYSPTDVHTISVRDVRLRPTCTRILVVFYDRSPT